MVRRELLVLIPAIVLIGVVEPGRDKAPRPRDDRAGVEFLNPDPGLLARVALGLGLRPRLRL
jgi:hypothetical protein